MTSWFDYFFYYVATSTESLLNKTIQNVNRQQYDRLLVEPMSNKAYERKTNAHTLRTAYTRCIFENILLLFLMHFVCNRVCVIHTWKCRAHELKIPKAISKTKEEEEKQQKRSADYYSGRVYLKILKPQYVCTLFLCTINIIISPSSSLFIALHLSVRDFAIRILFGWMFRRLQLLSVVKYSVLNQAWP